MDKICIKDKTFSLSIRESEILDAVQAIARSIDRDLKGMNPLFVCVLNGAFMFAADLMRHVSIPCELAFIRLASYRGEHTSGKVREILGLEENIQGRDVVVLEDVVDTGITLEALLASLRGKGARSVRVAAFLLKQDALQRDVTVDYVGMNIPNDFIVGYGLDYDGYGRNLKDIYKVEN